MFGSLVYFDLFGKKHTFSGRITSVMQLLIYTSKFKPILLINNFYKTERR